MIRATILLPATSLTKLRKMAKGEGWTVVTDSEAHGANVRRGRHSKVDDPLIVQAVLEMRRQGKSVRDVAAMLKVSTTTVQRVVRGKKSWGR